MENNNNNNINIDKLLEQLGLKEIYEIYELLDDLNKKELDYKKMLDECNDENKKSKIINYINKLIKTKNLLIKQMKLAELPETLEELKSINNIEFNEITTEKLDNFSSKIKKLSTEDITELKVKAKKGDVDAYFELGNLYKEGISVEKDIKLASKYYKKAGKLGHEKAIIVFENITGKKYIDLLNLDPKHSKTIYIICAVIPTAFIIYLLSYDNRTPEQLNLIAHEYFLEDNYKKAVKYYEKSINKGDYNVISKVADIYFYGNENTNFEPDLDTALMLYMMSSDNDEDINQAYSQYQIGNIYNNNNNNNNNIDMAVEYYEKSANNGYIISAKIIGDMYYYGDEISKDSTKALYYYQKCYSNPDMYEVMYNMGNIYFAGGGVTQDYTQALNWYKKASINNIIEASYLVGYMYEMGLGTDKDYDTAILYYQKAIDEEHLQAMYNLGDIYSNSETYFLDYELAFKYYKQGADLGHIDCMYKVSEMYSEGIGVIKHSLKSEEYLNMAKNLE